MSVRPVCKTCKGARELLVVAAHNRQKTLYREPCRTCGGSGSAAPRNAEESLKP